MIDERQPADSDQETSAPSEGALGRIDRRSLLRGAAALTGVTAAFMATSSSLAGQLPVWLHVLGQGSPVTDCDSGGPAIVELSLGRPETLRPHLSVGLPLSESRERTISPVRHTNRVMHITVRRQITT